MEHPRLRRDIQLVATVYRGRRVILFSDPLRLSGDTIALDMALYRFLEKLDGRHDRRDLLESLAGTGFPGALTLDDVDGLLSHLDRHYLLDSRGFRETERALRETFEREKDRLPVFAGRAYSSDPVELATTLDALENDLPALGRDDTGTAVTGLLAPHIDTTVAGNLYVDLYRRLRGRRYDRVVVLGINHQGQDGLYSVCDKGFLTPFGRVAPDSDFIGELKGLLPPGALASDDFGHKMEHSIELQIPCLQHYLDRPFQIVPILCGSLHPVIEDGDALEDRRFAETVQVLESMIARRGGGTLVVAAVDFSHLGHKFGHHEPAPVILPEALENDRRILSLIEQGDAEGLFSNACRTDHRFHVCGFPAMMVFVRLMRESRGRLLDHRVYHEDATGSAVTYAAMVFERASDG
ncbi:MAG: AmmeMemoRadiSam system protein B [Syntrophales bacterium]|nr:AmmeMemoRadiSam system protein B [Syntrophales bacterium]MCK9528712.1 AmmeMemoRadiSam system protein B [Syntrophales bacterium]MDX9922665.1 AmmeMemoRadiSam system protein B [Syntrophales bacterium]